MEATRVENAQKALLEVAKSLHGIDQFDLFIPPDATQRKSDGVDGKIPTPQILLQRSYFDPRQRTGTRVALATDNCEVYSGLSRLDGKGSETWMPNDPHVRGSHLPDRGLDIPASADLEDQIDVSNRTTEEQIAHRPSDQVENPIVAPGSRDQPLHQRERLDGQ
jgi:hypothetical protein